MIIGSGHKEGVIPDTEVRDLCREAVAGLDLAGKRVLALIPDATRRAPAGLLFRTLSGLLARRAARLDFLIALGTHRPMSDAQILKHLDLTPHERSNRYAGIGLFNHAWDDPAALATVGTIAASEMDRLTGGLLAQDVPIALNRRILDYDHILLIGPTFPHEVVGFSGGYKYLFPGIAGPDIINAFHWLGALVTNWRSSGVKDTAVRRVINRAAEFVRLPITSFNMVVTHKGLKGFFIGDPKDAFSAAADLSAQVHIRYMDRPFKRVLGVAATLYEDLWTAGKVMYKLEPIIADGGELVIYAPHVAEVSFTHGRHLDRIGYHCLDYFRAQMDRFADVPGAVLAHSTHVAGLGTFKDGVETPRIRVTLATGIPEERCRRVNLGYLDPRQVRAAEWIGREADGILMVDQAGEVLHRLGPEAR